MNDYKQENRKEMPAHNCSLAKLGSNVITQTACCRAPTSPSRRAVCDLNNVHWDVDALLQMRAGLSATTFRSSCQTTLCCGDTTVSVVSDKEKRKQRFLQERIEWVERKWTNDEAS